MITKERYNDPKCWKKLNDIDILNLKVNDIIKYEYDNDLYYAVVSETNLYYLQNLRRRYLNNDGSYIYTVNFSTLTLPGSWFVYIKKKLPRNYIPKETHV